MSTEIIRVGAISTLFAATIPVPPSVNALWATVGKRRVRTAAYRDWSMTAGRSMRSQWGGGRETIAHPVLIVMACERQTRSADIDNRLKPVGDLLESVGVLANDRLITAWLAVWWPKGAGRAHLAVHDARLSHEFHYHPHPASDGRCGGIFPFG